MRFAFEVLLVRMDSRLCIVQKAMSEHFPTAVFLLLLSGNPSTSPSVAFMLVLLAVAKASSDFLHHFFMSIFSLLNLEVA